MNNVATLETNESTDIDTTDLPSVSLKTQQLVRTDSLEYAKELARALSDKTIVFDNNTIEAALQNVDILLDDYRIQINMPLDAFEQMLSDGGDYKNYYDTGINTGYPKRDEYYIEQRQRIERALGFESNVTYGYLSYPEIQDVASDAKGYGNIALVLRQDVIDRSTFTLGDSIRPNICDPDNKPLLDFKSAAIAKEINDIAKYSGSDRSFQYIESQIADGISMQDVEKVVYKPRGDNTDRLRHFIELFLESTNDTQLTVCIDATDGIRDKNFVLAKEYPNIQFVMCVNTQKVSPYAQLNKLKLYLGSDQKQIENVVSTLLMNIDERETVKKIIDALKYSDGDITSTMAELFLDSVRAYSKAQTRLEQLKNNSRLHWLEDNKDLGDFPNNISFKICNS